MEDLSGTKQVVKVKLIFELLKYNFNYCLYTWSPWQSPGMLQYQNSLEQCLLVITKKSDAQSHLQSFHVSFRLFLGALLSLLSVLKLTMVPE